MRDGKVQCIEVCTGPTILAFRAEALARDDDVSVADFGRFAKNERPAREGRNPRTDERIVTGPLVGVSFKAGKVLKDALK